MFASSRVTFNAARFALDMMLVAEVMLSRLRLVLALILDHSAMNALYPLAFFALSFFLSVCNLRHPDLARRALLRASTDVARLLRIPFKVLLRGSWKEIVGAHKLALIA